MPRCCGSMIGPTPETEETSGESRLETKIRIEDTEVTVQETEDMEDLPQQENEMTEEPHPGTGMMISDTDDNEEDPG
jgi:hypothetical protein